MEFVKISVGDTLLMKKKHPCSSSTFTVTRVGSDVRIICTDCGRDLTIQREALERMIKRVIPKET